MSERDFNTNQFLSSIWENIDGNVFIGYKSTDNKFTEISYTSNSIEEIITYIDNHKQTNQLYFSPYTFINTSRKADYAKCGRCLFHDIDYGEGNHANNNQPYQTKRETLDTMLANYKKINLKPSYIMDTGGGFQPYWLTNEDIVSSYTKEEVKNFNECIFQLGLNEDERGKGFYNEKKDISSYLRIPNTYNLKGGGRLEVKIIGGTGKRYSFTEDILPKLSNLAIPPKMWNTQTIGKIKSSVLSETQRECIDKVLREYKKGVLFTFLSGAGLVNPFNGKTFVSHSEKEMAIIYYLMYELKFSPNEIKYVFDNYLNQSYTHYHKYDNLAKIDYLNRNISKYIDKDNNYHNILLSKEYPFVILAKGNRKMIDKIALIEWFNDNEIKSYIDDCITIDYTDRLWNGNLWKVFSEKDLKEYIYKSFRDKGIILTSDCVIELVKQITLSSFKIKSVATNYREKFVVSFLNGSLEVYPSQKKYQFLLNTWKKEDYCIYQIQENFDKWLFLEDKWIASQVGEYFRDFYKPEGKDTIQLYLSSVLIPDFNLEKVMLIKGKAGSGKTTLVEGITRLFNADSISSLEISKWGVTCPQ